MKNYAMMLLSTDDMFGEALRKRISELVAESSNRMFFFLGKPFDSPVGDERYNSVIFNLMKHLPMDGVIVSAGALSTYVTLDVLENFINQFNMLSIVSLTLPLSGGDAVINDNVKSSYKMTKHLLDFHDYRKFGYVLGPSSNIEVNDRYTGFLKAVNESEKTVEIFDVEGDFSRGAGYRATLKLLEKDVDVIVCANDRMALGVFDAAKEMNLTIPDDLAVVGFDNIEQAKLTNPPLTTIDQNFRSIAEEAYHILENGGGSCTLLPELVIRESCGCKSTQGNLRQDYYRIKDKYKEVVDSYVDIVSLAASFNHINSLKELNETLKQYFSASNEKEFYLCLHPEGPIQIENPTDFNYPEKMNLQFGYSQGSIWENIEFDLSDGLPDIVFINTKKRVFLVYPISLQDKSFGYIVAGSNTVDTLTFSALRGVLSNCLDRIYIYDQISNYNNQLKEYAFKDSLTGLYNRRGLFDQVEKDLDLNKHYKETSAIFYCDVNGLKQVNDTYGHGTGDDLIIAAANMLDEYFHEHLVARVGGDEFVVYSRHMTKAEADAKVQELSSMTKAVNNSLDIKLSISVGCCIYDRDRHNSLSELIDEADMNLYEMKKKRYKTNKK